MGELLVVLFVIFLISQVFKDNKNQPPKSPSKKKNDPFKQNKYICGKCGHVELSISKTAPGICPSCKEWGRFLGPYPL
jgi:rubrerythrin